MSRICEQCGTEFSEAFVRQSGRRMRFCQKRCRLDYYKAHAGMSPTTPRHRHNPSTSDRLYDDEELEWLKAAEHWRRNHGWRIPNCREVLEIARSLGYVKCASA